ncbi:DUF7504 family protein [Haloglomus salinum]|jgi:hypothetical protein|uniref:DUF7504 family protein n=1 Tax=Haloglomus salinum TaxID=2962673 RepID=UPI0020CA2591|nr:hypothetical protein [Haloglomus salinum]
MGPEGRGDEFEAALTELRRSGSAFLVAGAVPDRVHRQTCDELLGPADDERLFVRVGTGAESASDPTDGDRVLELDVTSRGAAATDAPAGGAGAVAGGASSSALTVVPTLSSAGAAFEAELAALDTTADRAPRVCVESVLPLVETSGEEQAFRFLHLVTSRVRRLGGTCHLHLPLAADSELTGTMAALVDTTVELRLADDHPEQRWHIHEAGIRSDWLPLTE